MSDMDGTIDIRLSEMICVYTDVKIPERSLALRKTRIRVETMANADESELFSFNP
jgi:hypothetical protein